jgi:hypothetical protein
VAELTNDDWSKLHAKAWRDPKFREQLETDPTTAIRAYGKEVGKTFDKILKLAPRPEGVPDDALELQHRSPPACC